MVSRSRPDGSAAGLWRTQRAGRRGLIAAATRFIIHQIARNRKNLSKKAHGTPVARRS
jgi:hypothetical protein